MAKRLLLLLTISVLTAAPAFGSDNSDITGSTVRFNVLLRGKVVGSHISTRRGNELEIHFEYSDRGRGPVLDSRIIIAEDGIPTRLETSGNDYLKAPVEEHFSKSAASAQWKNKAEAGTVNLKGSAIYYSLDGSLEELGVLAGALAQAEGKRLPILPSGEASVEVLDEVRIEANGINRKVRLYEISGLDFLPVSVWLDEEGLFFGSVSGWLSVIPEGWEDAIETLMKAQQTRSLAREHQWAQTLANRPANGLAITGARLFDTDSAIARENMTVLVVGDTIQAVGKDGTINLPANVQLINAAGKTLLPGLWDMHTHLSPEDGPLNIAAGVTSARDMANDTGSLLVLKGRFDSGEAIGPRVMLAGIIEGPGPFAGPTKALVDTPEEAIEWVERYAELDHDQVKIYSSMKPELVEPIARRAHELGLRVSGHIPAGMWAEDAVALGYDEITHINMFFLNFYKDVTDTRTPARFTEVAKRATDLDFESDEVRAFYEQGVPLVAGTDALTGFTLHRELELYVEAGIPAPEVLRIATLGSARIMNRDDKLGSIVPGKYADMILVDGNPDVDIRQIRNIRKIIKNGVIHDSAALYAAVGVR